MRIRSPVLLVFFLALIVRVGVVVAMNLSPYWRGFIWAGDSDLYDRIALDALRGAFYPPTPPGEIPLEGTPPLFPLYLALVYGLFGHGTLQVGLANAVVGAATAAAVLSLGTLTYGRRAGIAAGAIMALFPFQLFNTGYVLKETVLIGLLCFTVLALARLAASGSLHWATWSGIGLGLSTLGRYEEGGLLPFVALWMLTLPITRRRRLGTLALFGIVYGLTLVPWVAHNYAAYQQVMLFPSQPLAYLYNGNAPGLVGETSGYFEARGMQKPAEVVQGDQWWYVNESEAVNALVRRFTNDVPGTGRLFATKLVNMWRPSWEGASTANLLVLGGSYVAMMLFAVPALLLAPRNRIATLLRLVILFFFLFHLAFYGMIRQRQYVEPYLIVFASYGLCAALAAFRSWPIVGRFRFVLSNAPGRRSAAAPTIPPAVSKARPSD